MFVEPFCKLAYLEPPRLLLADGLAQVRFLFRDDLGRERRDLAEQRLGRRALARIDMEYKGDEAAFRLVVDGCQELVAAEAEVGKLARRHLEECDADREHVRRAAEIAVGVLGGTVLELIFGMPPWCVRAYKLGFASAVKVCDAQIHLVAEKHVSGLDWGKHVVRKRQGASSEKCIHAPGLRGG